MEFITRPTDGNPGAPILPFGTTLMRYAEWDARSPSFRALRDIPHGTVSPWRHRNQYTAEYRLLRGLRHDTEAGA